MSDRQRTILNLLQDGPITSYSLAARLNAPTASVRRDIRSLRQQGWNINDARDNDGLYRLAPATV